MPTPAPASAGLRLRPFRAVRYAPATAGDLSDLICPPYDTLGADRTRALRRRPHHLARLLYSAQPGQAARQLEHWLRCGVLVRDERPALYVYQQRTEHEVIQRGIIGELELTGGPFPILPHEDVQEHVVRQRAAHLAGLGAQLEPLLLGYRTSAAGAASGAAASGGLRSGAGASGVWSEVGTGAGTGTGAWSEARSGSWPEAEGRTGGEAGGARAPGVPAQSIAGRPGGSRASVSPASAPRASASRPGGSRGAGSRVSGPSGAGRPTAWSDPVPGTTAAPPSPAAALLAATVRRPPLASARDGHITHTVWACTDPAEQAVLTAHLARAHALIADGHHRHAACLRLAARHPNSPWRRSLALLVDQDEHPLRLTAIHRVIPSLDAERAADAAAGVARVRPLPDGPRPPRPGELVLTGAGRSWLVTDPDPRALDQALHGLPPRWRELPTAVADQLLLRRAWSVPELPGAVFPVHDARLAAGSVAAPGRGAALLLPRVEEETVRSLAGAGVLLPRKSTSFGPKPAAGLVLRVPRA